LCRLRHLFSSELCSLLGAPRLCLSPLLGTTASPFSSLIYSVNFTTLPFLALLIMRGTTASPFSPFIEYSLCQLRHLFSFKLCSLSGALRLRRSSLLLSLAFVGFDTSSFPSFAHYQRCHGYIKVCRMFPWARLCQDLIQLCYHFLCLMNSTHHHLALLLRSLRYLVSSTAPPFKYSLCCRYPFGVTHLVGSATSSHRVRCTLP